jgi:hypothetical protein
MQKADRGNVAIGDDYFRRLREQEGQQCTPCGAARAEYQYRLACDRQAEIHLDVPHESEYVRSDFGTGSVAAGLLRRAASRPCNAGAVPRSAFASSATEQRHNAEGNLGRRSFLAQFWLRSAVPHRVGSGKRYGVADDQLW